MFWKKVGDKEIKGLQKAVAEVAKNAIEEAIFKLNDKVKSLKTLNEEIDKLKKDIKELELQKTMDEREVKQLVKIKQDNQEVEYKKKAIDLEKDYQKKEMDLQKDYHKKVMNQVDDARKEMKEVYNSIMERLPNLNASLELVAGGGAKKNNIKDKDDE